MSRSSLGRSAAVLSAGCELNTTFATLQEFFRAQADKGQRSPVLRVIAHQAQDLSGAIISLAEDSRFEGVDRCAEG